MKNPTLAAFRAFSLFLLSATVACSAATFQELKDQYNKGVFALEGERREKVATLNKDYLATLERLKQEAASKGDLDGALAARNEIERVNRGQLAPVNKSALPSWLVTRQSLYEQDVQRATKDLYARFDSLKQNYVRALDELQKQLTVAGDLDGAVAARAEKQRVLGSVSKPINVAEGSPTAPNALPPELSRLGNLSKDLVAYFSLSSLESGGLTWSRVPINASFTEQVKIRVKEGHKTADFNLPGAVLRIDPPLRLGESYTLACWISLPVPQDQSVVFNGTADQCLVIGKESARWWIQSKLASGDYCKLNKLLKGWYHAAITCNGKETSFFWDGTRKGGLKMTMDNQLAFLGNTYQQYLQRANMCDSLADCFIFSRDLSAAELAQVASVHKFK